MKIFFVIIVVALVAIPQASAVPIIRTIRKLPFEDQFLQIENESPWTKASLQDTLPIPRLPADWTPSIWMCQERYEISFYFLMPLPYGIPSLFYLKLFPVLKSANTLAYASDLKFNSSRPRDCRIWFANKIIQISGQIWGLPAVSHSVLKYVIFLRICINCLLCIYK